MKKGMFSKNAVVTLFSLSVFVAMALMLYQSRMFQNKQINLLDEMLLQEAISNFESIVVTRSWNAGHGAVYVYPKNGLKPNPYLDNNTIKDENDKQLIKINPAWMTRQISEIANRDGKYKYKITSLNPLNPKNKADKFETKALEFFEKNKEEKYFYELTHGGETFNFMGSLKVTEACMECHRKQGYKVGDIRGGIRVSFPTGAYQKIYTKINNDKTLFSTLIILGGIVVVLLFYIGISKIFYATKKIQQLNEGLEKTVDERTASLRIMYQHEKYLKNLLKTIADINEMFISSASIDSMIDNCVDKLSAHNGYGYASIGLSDQRVLNIKGWLSQNKKTNVNKSLDLQGVPESFVEEKVHKAIYERNTIIEKIPHDKTFMEDSTLQWIIIIPLRDSDKGEILGVLKIVTYDECGFAPEEVHMLENLASDIAMAIHSHLQRQEIEQMELDKVNNYEETILAFVDIIEQRDSYTAGHTIRVATYCKAIAEAMGYKPDEINKLEKAAILHDIGKVAIPDAILLKPSKLSSLEYELIKYHSEAGYRMLKKIDMYKELAEIIRYHHARYDGKGYPLTKTVNEVPMLSYIMALADAYDAMTTNRIYKKRMNSREALAEISKYSGSQFHPDVAKIALKVLGRIEIEETSQIPKNELEEKRFAYFFLDNLTELHNEAYLQIVLHSTNRPYEHLILLDMKNFSQYNKRVGWDGGNELLREIAHWLKEKFPNALAFRYHGDDFVLLFEKEPVIDLDELNSIHYLTANNLYFEMYSKDIDHKSFENNKIMI